MRVVALLLLVASVGAWGTEEDATPAPSPAPEDAEPAEDLTPRERYNAGLAQLAAGDPEAAAEAFLAARDAAGPDPALRYRAAFNLGLALATGVAAEAPPEEAIETLRQSAAWFNDVPSLLAKRRINSASSSSNPLTVSCFMGSPPCASV